MQSFDSDVLEMLCRRITLVEINDAPLANIIEPLMQKLQGNGELQSMIEKAKNRESYSCLTAEEIAQRFIKYRGKNEIKQPE